MHLGFEVFPCPLHREVSLFLGLSEEAGVCVHPEVSIRPLDVAPVRMDQLAGVLSFREVLGGLLLKAPVKAASEHCRSWDPQHTVRNLSEALRDLEAELIRLDNVDVVC